MIVELMYPNTNLLWLLPAVLETFLFLLFVWNMDDRMTTARWRMSLLVLGLIAYQIGVQALLEPFWIDFILCAIGFFLFLCLTKSNSKQQDLYVCCIFLLCAEAGKILATDIVMPPFYNWLAGFSPLVVTLTNFILAILLDAAALAVLSRWVFNGGAENLSWQQAVAVLLPVVPFAYVRSSEYVYNMENTSLYHDMVVVLIMLLICMIAIIVINAANLSSVVRKTEVLQMEALLKEQHQQYAMKKSATDAINRQYHDIKHYLASLDSTNDVTQVQAFIDGMNKSLRPYEVCVETGNETVDIVLAEKNARCVDENIRLVPYVDASQLGFMNSFDLCALLGNALDNAIEAVEPLEEDSRREVALKISYDRKLVVMRLVNPYDGSVQTGARWPLTSKPDRENHGFGMASIARVAEKYGGAASYDADGSTFTLNVIIPLPAQ